MLLASRSNLIRSIYGLAGVALMACLVSCGGGSSSSSSGSSAVATPGVYYAVSNTNDSGAGSLRAAITSVNSAPSSQYSGITFSVSGTITLASSLPAITNKVLIDGATAPGYAAATVINGTATAPTIAVAVNFNSVGSGFTFNSGSAGSGINALSIIGSTSNGITLNASNITIVNNYIGLNLSGAVSPNAGSGIYIASASTNNIIGVNPQSISNLYSNVISGNTGHGIQIVGSSGNTIQANAIGTNYLGSTALGNGGNGILVTYFSSSNTIGGTAFYDAGTNQTNNPTGNKGTVPIVFIAPPLGNLISGNALNGVLIDLYSEGTVLSGNFIGTNAKGLTPIGNGRNGVLVSSANNNSLIGCTFPDNPFIYYNVLSGNALNGLQVTNSNNVLVQANFFGIAASNANSGSGGTTSIMGNALNGILVDGTSSGVQVGGVIPLGNVSAGNGVDGIQVAGTASSFTTFNTFAGLYAFAGAAPNLRNGITISSSGANNLIRTNVASGNMGNGIELTATATGVTVDPNVVGPNTYGTGALTGTSATGGYGNGANGILVDGSGNYIGGYNGSVIPQNTFSGNRLYGIHITGNNNYVFNASIGLGTSLTAVTGLGNGAGGVLITGTGNSVGPTPPAFSTTTPVTAYISANTGNGITLTGSGNTVTGNYFGYAAFVTDTTPLPDQACNTGLSIVDAASNTVSANNTGTCAP